MYIVSFACCVVIHKYRLLKTKMSHKITMVHKPSKRSSSPISTLKGHVQCIYTIPGHCSLRGSRY